VFRFQSDRSLHSRARRSCGSSGSSSSSSPSSSLACLVGIICGNGFLIIPRMRQIEHDNMSKRPDEIMTVFAMTPAGHIGVVEPAGHCFKYEAGGG
jgi:hypothetical protein